MFLGSIQNTELTSPFANRVFDRITAPEYRNDAIALAVARLYLYDKLPAGESFSLDYANECDNANPSAEWLSSFEKTPANILFVDIGHNNIVSQFIRRNYATILPGYQYAEDISGVMSRGWTGSWDSDPRLITILRSQTNRKTLVFVDSMNVQIIHLLSGLIPHLAFWLYDTSKHPRDQMLPGEIELMRALLDVHSGWMHIHPLMQSALKEKSEVCAGYDLETAEMEYSIEQFETSGVQCEIERYEYEIQLRRTRIQTKMQEVSELYRQNELDNLVLDGLKGCKHQSSDLLDYFQGNDSVAFKQVDDGHLYFYTKGFMSNWDQNYYDVLRDNHDSWLYGVSYPIETERALALLDALFKTEQVKLRMYAAWCLNSTAYLEIWSDTGSSFPKIKNYYGNPHTVVYKCYGSWQQEIDRCAQQRNFTRACDIAVLEGGNINLADSIVSSNFFSDLFEDTRKCIVFPDGTEMTPDKAANYLYEQQKNSSQEETKNGKTDSHR